MNAQALGRRLRVERVTTLDGLRQLAPEWSRLVSGGPGPVPFLDPGWFECCLAGFGAGNDWSILCFRSGDELVGIAPLWTTPARVRGLPVRRLEFIHGPDTPRVDLIARTDVREAVIDALLDTLDGSLLAWDVAELGQWPADSPCFIGMQRRLARSGRGRIERVSSEVPYLALEGTWESFLEGRSVKYRKTARNVANRLSRMGQVEVERHAVDPEGVALSEAIAISERSWKQREGIGLASTEAAQRFFRALVRLAEGRGWLMLWLLRIDGVAVAMEFDIEHDGRVWALRSDFDERFREASPGAHLQLQILQHLFENGYREYHTGPGLNAYKLHTTDRISENRSLAFFRSSLKGRALWALEGALVPLLRRLIRPRAAA